MRYFCLPLLIFCAVTTIAAPNLSRDTARRRISELAQSKLPSDAIEVRRIISQGDTAIAESTITLAFQMVKNADNVWVVDAVRLGDRDWVTMKELITAIYHGRPPVPAVSEYVQKTSVPRTETFHVNTSEFEKQRQIMIEVGSSPLVPDSIEIRRVISQSAVRAIVESTVTMGFRFKLSGKDWQIEAARLGDRDWVVTNDLYDTLNEGRRGETVSILEKLAAGINNYRSRNGSTPVAKDIVELTNLLHPDYMIDLVRLDGWGQVIEYSGSGTTFRVLSRGPDARWGTPDDIAVDGNSPPRP